MNSIKTCDIESFCTLQRELLQLEYDSELQQSTDMLASLSNIELQDRGVALLGLVVSALNSGLFGKTIVTLQHHLFSSRKHTGVSIPSNSMSSGDIVGIFTDSFSGAPLYTGVVHGIDSTCVKIVLDGEDNGPKLWDFTRFNVAKIGSNVTHKRLMMTVSDLEKSHHSLMPFMFGEVSPPPRRVVAAPSLDTGTGVNLNGPQQDAVLAALSNRLVTVIHGPPGTGKTTTLASFIAESVASNPNIKILACAPSNVAVDNLALKVVSAGVQRVVRVGHPTRVNDDMIKHSLDSLVSQSDFKQSCGEIRKEIQAILDSRKGYTALRDLRKELKDREAKSIEQVVTQSNVVFTTCNGAFNLLKRLMKNVCGGDPQFFDLCVIDECAQGLEISSWIPILQSKRVVLGGDHKQLSATVKSAEAETRGLGVTLFQRVVDRLAASDDIVHMLTIQYRMNETIMGWSNREFYDGKLVAHESVKSQTLSVPSHYDASIGDVDMTSVIESPFVFCDTLGVDGMEEDAVESVSKSNVGEASIVARYVALINVADITGNISVISPYMKQTELIRTCISTTNPSVEVSTVDSFQGRESDVIVISLVRSNRERIVGFLSDYRRLNVAVTRARKQVFIVGNSESISSDAVLKSLFDYASEDGLVVSAQSFVVDDGGIGQASIKATVPRSKPIVKKPAPTSKPAALKAAAPITRAVTESTETIDEEMFNQQVSEAPAGGRFLFPPTLTNAERRIIHSICDRDGIAHGSVGIGEGRQVWIHKKPLSQSNTDGRLHHDVMPADPVAAESTPYVHSTAGVVLKPKKVAAKPVAPEIPAKPAGVCPHAPCPMSTKLIALSCSLCGKSYCVAHATPEAHGCGDAVRAKAKASIKEELRRMKNPPIIQGKGGVSTQALRKRMDAKLGDMKSKRATASKKPS